MTETKQKAWSSRRLRALIVIAALTLLVVVYYREYKFARPVGSGPAGPEVDREAFEVAWSERDVHVLGIGDSITAGLGAKSKSHRYFDRVIKNPPDEFDALRGICLTHVLPSLRHENFAISGSESQLHFDVISEQLSEQPADTFGLVLMTSGGNDLIHMYGRSAPRECAMYGATMEQAIPWIAKFEKRLEQIFSMIVAPNVSRPRFALSAVVAG